MVTITITVTVGGVVFPGATSTVYTSGNVILGSCVSDSTGKCAVTFPLDGGDGYIIVQAQGQTVNSGSIIINTDSSYAFNINPAPVDPTATILFLGAIGVFGVFYLFRRRRRG